MASAFYQSLAENFRHVENDKDDHAISLAWHKGMMAVRACDPNELVT